MRTRVPKQRNQREILGIEEWEGSVGRAQVIFSAMNLVGMTLFWWMHASINLSKPIGYTALGRNVHLTMNFG